MDKLCGGMEFPVGRPLLLASPPAEVPTIGTYFVPLDRPPVVVEGQPIRRAQPLIDCGPDEWSVVSPIDGRVRRIVRTSSTLASSHGVSCVTPPFVLEIDPTDKSCESSTRCAPPAGRRLDDWLVALQQLGRWPGLDGRVGLERQLDVAVSCQPDQLICIGLDDFSPYPLHGSLLASFANDAVLGTLMLADLLGIKDVSMLSTDHPMVLSRLKPSCRQFRLRLITVRPSYPASDPTLVAWSHGRGRRLPYGVNPVEERLVFISPWTAIRIARWVDRRRLDYVQPVMIGRRERGRSPTIVFALPGCVLANLDPQLDPGSIPESTSRSPHEHGGEAHDQTVRVVMGNPLTGQDVASTPLARLTGQAVMPQQATVICVVNRADHSPAMPCISCGWCVEACPTDLHPIALMQLCQESQPKLGLDSRLNESLRWCIDCGLCSHTCPSRIPIAEVLRQASAKRYTQDTTPVGCKG